MNNKNTIILAISITGIVTLAIAILVLTIFKGNEMKEWLKKNVLCCFGKKKEEKKDVKIQTEQPVNRVTMEQIDDLERRIDEWKKNNDRMNKELEKLDNHANKVIQKHESILREMGIEDAEEFKRQHTQSQNSNN